MRRRNLPIIPYTPIQPSEIPAARAAMCTIAAYLFAIQATRKP